MNANEPAEPAAGEVAGPAAPGGTSLPSCIANAQASSTQREQRASDAASPRHDAPRAAPRDAPRSLDAGHHRPAGRQRATRAGGPQAAHGGSAHAVHDELLVGLGRRFRGATLKLDVELRAPITRQIFRRDFVYVSQQLHALEASRRVQGLDRQVLNDALMTIERHGELAKLALKKAADETLTLIALQGHANAQVEFTLPTQLQATIVSPYARVFIDVLRQADDMLTQLERAWLLGLVDPATKAYRASDCRKVLHVFKDVVREQRHVVGQQVRRVNAARRSTRDDLPSSLDASRAVDLRHAAADVALPADRLDATTLQDDTGSTDAGCAAWLSGEADERDASTSGE